MKGYSKKYRLIHAPGHVYVYQIHTHHLMNVVSAEIGNSQAMLIRAVEPLDGIDLMKGVDRLKT